MSKGQHIANPETLSDGEFAEALLDAQGRLQVAVTGTATLPTGAATEATVAAIESNTDGLEAGQATVNASLATIIANAPRVLAIGETVIRDMEIAFEGAIINSDPGTQWATQGTVSYAGTVAILTPPQTLPGVPTTMVANLPTTYTSAASLICKLSATLVDLGPGYDFYVGLTSAYSGNPLASSALAYRFRAGPAPTYYPIVSIYEKADLGGTTETERDDWDNTLPLKLDNFQAPSILQIRVDEDGVFFIVGRTEVREDYFGGDRTDLDLPNLAVGAPVLRLFAYANATQNSVGTKLVIANPRLYRAGVSEPVSLFIEGRLTPVTIPAGATRPIIALRCKLTRNGFASGARYYPTAFEAHTETRRIDFRVYLGTEAELVTALTGASFVDVTAKEANGWLEIDRSATEVTLTAGSGAYRAAGPSRVESLTTVIVPLADSFPPQKPLAIRGDGTPLILLLTATNVEGVSSDVTVTGIHISQVL